MLVALPRSSLYVRCNKLAKSAMSDIFEDIFANPPLDPVEAARRAVRPQLRKRFYDRADVTETAGQFAVSLDGRPVMTPARKPLAAPARALATLLAEEWNAQGEFIDPATMPLTRLANTIIDGVTASQPEVAAEIAKYLGADLVFYRADTPEGLVARQSAAWDPILDWARETLGARFVLSQGVMHVAQPDSALAAAAAAIPGDDAWRLGALHAVTTLTGSALIALALMHKKLSVDSAWTAAHIDEDWNMEFWGRDALAMERRAFRFREMQAAASVLREVP
jgi:chaperone required for assembly of F1-ATPase